MQDADGSVSPFIGSREPTFPYVLNGFKFKKVEMKSKGLIGGIKFSDNGKKLGLSLNSAKSPSETHIVNLGKRNLDYLDVVQWTESEVGGLNTDEFVLPNLISFKSFDDLEVPAFIYSFYRC